VNSQCFSEDIRMSEAIVPKPKRAWPLFLLAGASFLPGFGVFFGAAAVTWGLISDRPRAMVAAGLGAAGAVLNLIGGALLVWQVQKTPAYASVGATSARRDLRKLAEALEGLPDSLARSSGYRAPR
jgi:heme A synthase